MNYQIMINKYFLRSMTAMALVFQFSFMPAHHQDDCLKQIRSLYRKLYDLARTSDKGVYYLDYHVMVQVNKKNVPVQESDVQVYSNRDKLFVISDQMEVYRDAKASVHVLPQRKMIYVYDGIVSDKNKMDNALQRQLMLNDSLFQYCTAEYCGVSSNRPEGSDEIKLKVSPAGVRRFHITNMHFRLDKAGESIKECTFYFDEKNPLKEMKTIIRQCSYDYKTGKLNSTALEQVIKSDNTLLGKYKGYKLIDNRGKQEISDKEKQLAVSRMKMVSMQKNK